MATRKHSVPKIASPTVLDRLIGYVDPAAGHRRLIARTKFEMLDSYAGASKSKRSLRSWFTRGQSADADLLGELPTLQERSRDMIRNDPVATSAYNTSATHVVGSGLRLEATLDHRLVGFSEQQARDWEGETEQDFRMWAESVNADATRSQNFYGLQDLAFRSAFESGDVFALLPMIARRGSPYQLAVQLIEADRVSNEDNKTPTPTLSGGIQMDVHGAPTHVHILKQHPGGLGRVSREWDVVPVYGEKSGRRNVLHLYRRLRPGQTRGVPELAPVMEPLRQLGQYTGYELQKAMIQSLFTVFIHNAGGDEPSPLESAVSSDGPNGSDRAVSDWDGKLGAGLAVDLDGAADITMASATSPNPGFDPFFVAIVRMTGASIGIPYEVLIKHFTSSYSASKAAMNEAWAFFKCRRSWLADGFCQPIYQAFLEEAIALGRIQAPGYFNDPLRQWAFSQSMWVGDGRGSLEPLREAKAIGELMDRGITTGQRAALNYDGSNYEQNLRQIAREKALAHAAERPAAGQRFDEDDPDMIDPDDIDDEETDANAY